MDASIVHSLPGRARFRADPDKFNELVCREAVKIFSSINAIKSAEVNPRTGSILIYYEAGMFDSQTLLLIVNKVIAFCIQKNAGQAAKTKISLGWSYIGYQMFRLFCPPALRPFFVVLSALPYIFAALRSLIRLKFDIPLLDGTAIAVSLMARNFKAASTLIMLLKSGQYLEKWAKNRSRESLAGALSLNVGNVWVRRKNQDELTAYNKLCVGDEIILRSGTLIPVDGEITGGNAFVNESSMTGEAMPAARFTGDSVHAGTVVEDGEIVVRILKKGGDTRYHNIIKLVEESQNSKTKTERRANELANRMAPLSLIVALLTFIITGNFAKAQAVLSVDYSCAIRLAAPLVFISAMRESLVNGAFFKGSVPIENLALSDTVVFDKTGTLTMSVPEVVKVTVYGGETEKQVLKIAACLEEHFPHPVAKAVVKYASEMKVKHREEHSEVKYIAAHGIATQYKNKHTVIGSKHFVSEDEKIDVSIAAADEEQAVKAGHSLLYLAFGGKLIGLIAINDPIRPEAVEVISMLYRSGVKNIYLLSGDNRLCVKRIAQRLAVNGFQAQLLPQDKTDFIKNLQAKGHTVAFVGDGMNDSPALAAADSGIAMKDGAELAQNAADIILKTSSLYPLVAARIIAQRALKRERKNTAASISVNSLLILTGLLGSVSSTYAIWLHNLTTLAISLNSMRPLLGSGPGK